MFRDLRAAGVRSKESLFLKAGLGLLLLVLQLTQGKSFYPPGQHEHQHELRGQQEEEEQPRGVRPLLSSGDNNPLLVPILPYGTPAAGGDYEKELLLRGLVDNNAEGLVDEEGSSASMESAIMNYLNTKRMIQRMKQQIQATTSIQHRKRNNGNGNYWKMCAFNAVSCFG